MIMTEPTIETEATDPAEDAGNGVTEVTAESEADPSTEPSTDQQDQDQAAEQTEPETFPAEYVKQLRTEAKDHRVKAKEANDRADALGKRLHTALVTATGRLADPTDLPYDPEHLDDPEALTAAIDALLTAKPHLASRKPIGQIGQGETGGTGTVDLAALLRSRA